jgi:hypothetical protein
LPANERQELDALAAHFIFSRTWESFFSELHRNHPTTIAALLTTQRPDHHGKPSTTVYYELNLLATALDPLRAIARRDAHSVNCLRALMKIWLELHLCRNASVVSLEFKEDY